MQKLIILFKCCVIFGGSHPQCLIENICQVDIMRADGISKLNMVILNIGHFHCFTRRKLLFTYTHSTTMSTNPIHMLVKIDHGAKWLILACIVDPNITFGNETSFVPLHDVLQAMLHFVDPLVSKCSLTFW